MSDDRDRRAAREWLLTRFNAANIAGLEALSPGLQADLAAFRAAARAEGAAEAIEACCAAAEALREGPHTPTIGALVETMRRASPAGLVAVRAGDLRHLLAAYLNAYACVKAAQGGVDADRLIVDMGDDSSAAIDRIRAAVARKEG